MTFPDPSLLMHPQIPRPLHGLNPRKLLGRTWWDQERRIAYRKHNYHCHACGVKDSQALYRKRLEGHEQYEIDFNKHHALYIGTVALCHACHNFIHIGRLEILVQKMQCSKRKFNKIQQHGRQLLQQAKLIRPRHIMNDKHWSEWRLQIGNRTFKPRFKSQKEWAVFYRRKR